MPVDLKKLKKMYKENEDMFPVTEPLVVVDRGRDVMFNFTRGELSVWKGTKTSVMASDHQGRKVLRWLIGKDFNEEALDIIQSQLDELYI